MCKLCNGTHVVHEMNNIGYWTSCCPVCGPEPVEIQMERLQKLKARKGKIKKEAASIDHH